MLLSRVSLAQLYFVVIGRRLIGGFRSVRGIGAFTLISLSVMLSKFGVARPVTHPMIIRQIARSGVLLLPMAGFLSIALGLIVIGQTVSLLSRVGATQFLGTIMVVVVVGTGALIGSAVFLGAFDTSVHDTDDVARLGLPVLGHVPGFPGDHVGSLGARGALRARVPSFMRWRFLK